MKSDNILVANNICKSYFHKGKQILAVRDVSLVLDKGEVLGLVGKTGCGKSTLAKCLFALTSPDSGQVIINDKNLYSLKKKEKAMMRPKFQYIFQNPYSSLNPSKTVFQIIGEAAIYHKICTKNNIKGKIISILEQCGLSEKFLNRYPSQMSGGQCQKVAIARAMILNPNIIICDEITSALDNDSKNSIIDLLKDLKNKYNLSIIFITHDIDLLNDFADRILLMSEGAIKVV